MRDTVVGPRVLLKRLRELMAEPLEPQERLDRIVRDIAKNMVAEVCSLYVLRADSVLELYATEGLNPGSVHHAQLRLGQGLVGTIAASRRGRSTCPTRRSIRPSPICRRRARRSIIPSSACRCCAPGARSACWSSRTAPSGNYREDEVEALETTAMVIAEMIADRRSRAADPARHRARPAAAGLLQRPLPSTMASGSAMSCCTSRASSSPTCSTRIPRRRSAVSTPRWARSGCRSTTCCRAATSPSRASTATCSKPTACSPTIAAG